MTSLPIALGGVDLPDRVSEGMTLRLACTVRTYDPEVLDNELAEATPANPVLLEWARTAEQLPQSWWDDETDPFTCDDN